MVIRSCRSVLSLTTRFCLPYEGMTTLDYLSSGSAVVLHNSNGSSLDIVTCKHVACPWMFPKYFSATWEWLQYVNENHVQHSLQLLSINDANLRPAVLLELPLAPQVHTHKSRDLALLTLKDSTALESWRTVEQKFKLQPLTLQQTPCESGDAVVFSGHRHHNCIDKKSDNYHTCTTVSGRFVGRSSSGQEFAWSQELLEEGMCGGAVIGKVTKECVGVVEGIVPIAEQGDEKPLICDNAAHAASQLRQSLAGHVAFIPASDVRQFIESPDGLLLTGIELPPHFCEA
ncbi:hypothetical protein CCR75_008652 [Bremia lactucae]|uniref:Uncharacterized protein n=1 Tax=Bremia lactucae TaxID=4779 RepID=A0A976IB31_BRELC|nr:hypothetical protein CCR75_008652 [Bremia lactucae]